MISLNYYEFLFIESENVHMLNVPSCAFYYSDDEYTYLLLLYFSSLLKSLLR